MRQKRSRAWNLLRLALLWARKGGILKCRLMSELRHVNKHLTKAIHRHSSMTRRRLDAGAIYGERQLSFDDTPILRLRISRPGSLRFKLPNIPCIKPAVVDFDYDFDDEVYVNEDEGENFEYEEEDEGIDQKADEFIERFYRQMKMQQQVSYIEYN